MAAKTGSTSIPDFTKLAFGPATRFNEAVAANLERIARYQYQVAGDLMQFAIDQMNATVKAKDLPTLIAKQREIGTKFAEKAQARQHDLTAIAAESQATLANLIEDATAVASGKAA